MNKRLGVIFIIIVAVVAASEILLPYLVESLLARGMEGVAGAQEIAVDVVKRPAVLMLDGKFDRVSIHATDAKIEKINFSDIDIVLEKPELDMGELFRQRQVTIKSVKNVDFTAVVTQEELAKYLSQSVKGVKNAEVAIQDGIVQVSCNYSLGSVAKVAITLEGKVKAGNDQKLKFVTERFLINNSATGNIGGTVLAEISMVDLHKLPFGVSVKTINMEDGKITIHADNQI